MSQKFCRNCNQSLTITASFCHACGAKQANLTGQLPAQAMLDNRYVIDTLVGKGGMGAVYRAVDTRLSGRVCAIKEMSVLSVPTAERYQAAQNFEQEATLLAKLCHPNLPQVHNFFQDGNSGRYYLEMDFVQGVTLEELLEQQRPFDEQQVRAWAYQLCDVLTYLHTQNPPVIFRDLKPQNIMVDQRGQLKLIDFGIARFFKPAQSTDTQALGTVGYAPPEQHGRGQTDPRSDIYSLGATLWRLLTRQDPADAPYRLPVVSYYNPAISPQLDHAIQKAMSLQPEHRFQTALEFRQTLEGNKIDLPIGGTVILKPKPVNNQLSIQVGFTMALLMLVVAGVYALFAANNGSTATATPTTAIVVVTSVVEVTVSSVASPPLREESTPISTTPEISVVVFDPTDTPTPTATMTTAPTATPTVTAAPITALPPTVIAPDGMTMVLIPAGWFTMGSTSANVDTAVSLCRTSCPRSEFTNEMPQREVYISDFYMGLTEVTNDLYQDCVRSGRCVVPNDSNAPDSRYKVNEYYNLPQYGNYPVVRIRWEDAHNYCQWIGGRLPTEAEWEKAARGSDGRIFPWGNSFDSRNANTQDGGGDILRPVASYPDGRSPYCLYDMAGSAWEYVQDWYSASYYQNAPSQDPQGPSSGSDRVLRGGSYSDYKAYARVTNRGTPSRGTVRSGYRGFRCAMDVP
jgi:serine/threonine protein kinase